MDRREQFVFNDIRRLGFTMPRVINYTKAIARNKGTCIRTGVVRDALLKKGFAPDTVRYLMEVADDGTRV